MKFNLLIIFLCLVIIGNINAQETGKLELERQTAVAQPDLPAKPMASEPETANSVPKQTGNYVRPDANQRFKKYLNRTFGPVALGTKLLSAGFLTAVNRPEEWKGNWKGFGKRYASSMGRSVIKETAVYSLDEALKLDSNFYPSQKRDAGSKFKNAVISTFTARNASGKRVVGVPRLVGTYTGSIVAAETWYPKRFDYKDGLRNGTISIGTDILVNLFREFFRK